MKIYISNVEALVVEKIKIKVFELSPNSKLRISMEMELPWCTGEQYSSYGVFIFFASEGLPNKLEKVPLEYFEKIFEWIENNEITKSKEIFLHGTSKGAELALLLASRYKKIKKVVAVEPHAYCFQALNGMMSGKNVSSWSYKDQSIPYIEVNNNIFFEDQKKAVENGMTFGFASTYKKSIKKAANKEEARIKVENSEADILMIAGKEDNIWNSYE